MEDYDRAETKSGQFRVYHKNNAGCPECHDESGDPSDEEGFTGGPWYFEPADWDTNEVFSVGYPSKENALKGAEEYEAENNFQTALDVENVNDERKC